MQFLFLFVSLLYASTAHAADSGDLYRAVVTACGCVVVGTSVGTPTDRSTWTITYDPGTSAPQRAAGNAVLASFNMLGASAPPAPGVPPVIGSMNAKVALLRAGLLPAVQAWVNTQSAEQQLIWNTATNFRRDSTLIADGAAALGLSSAQLDQLFITAATIQP
jgi:hypothetical protein